MEVTAAEREPTQQAAAFSLVHQVGHRCRNPSRGKLLLFTSRIDHSLELDRNDRFEVPWRPLKVPFCLRVHRGANTPRTHCSTNCSRRWT